MGNEKPREEKDKEHAKKNSVETNRLLLIGGVVRGVCVCVCVCIFSDGIKKKFKGFAVDIEQLRAESYDPSIDVFV